MFSVIPAIDLLDGQVVRLKQGDYSQVTNYDYSPAGLAKHYTNMGAKRIHLVDLNGAKDGKLVNLDAITQIRQSTDVMLDLGGGIRSIDNAQALFDLGIDELILGSLLVKAPEIAKAIVQQFPGKISAGLDTKDGMVATDGWEATSTRPITALLADLNNWPLASVIFTDIATDGMMTGPNLAQLQLVCEHSAQPVIASGGIRGDEDVEVLRGFHEQLTGCITGKAILEGTVTTL